MVLLHSSSLQEVLEGVRILEPCFAKVSRGFAKPEDFEMMERRSLEVIQILTAHLHKVNTSV